MNNVKAMKFFYHFPEMQIKNIVVFYYYVSIYFFGRSQVGVIGHTLCWYFIVFLNVKQNHQSSKNLLKIESFIKSNFAQNDFLYLPNVLSLLNLK